MFDTVLLRSLIAVADTGGFTRAAHRLHLTQSAISAHIRRLEREAGQKLLERTTRSVSLTPAGARLAGYARTILALHDDARASLGAGRRVSGTVYV
ncbi:LysR family transcriptional regulator, partial [Enterococcus faecium]